MGQLTKRIETKKIELVLYHNIIRRLKSGVYYLLVLTCQRKGGFMPSEEQGLRSVAEAIAKAMREKGLEPQAESMMSMVDKAEELDPMMIVYLNNFLYRNELKAVKEDESTKEAFKLLQSIVAGMMAEIVEHLDHILLTEENPAEGLSAAANAVLERNHRS